MTPSIIIYIQTGCLFSDEAAAWLDAQGIPYTERDINTDTTALTELETMETIVMPTIIVGREVVYGFAVDRLRRLLAMPSGNPT